MLQKVGLSHAFDLRQILFICRVLVSYIFMCKKMLLAKCCGKYPKKSGQKNGEVLKAVKLYMVPFG